MPKITNNTSIELINILDSAESVLAQDWLFLQRGALSLKIDRSTLFGWNFPVVGSQVNSGSLPLSSINNQPKSVLGRSTSSSGPVTPIQPSGSNQFLVTLPENGNIGFSGLTNNLIPDNLITPNKLSVSKPHTILASKLSNNVEELTAESANTILCRDPNGLGFKKISGPMISNNTIPLETIQHKGRGILGQPVIGGGAGGTGEVKLINADLNNQVLGVIDNEVKFGSINNNMISNGTITPNKLSIPESNSIIATNNSGNIFNVSASGSNKEFTVLSRKGSSSSLEFSKIVGDMIEDNSIPSSKLVQVPGDTYIRVERRKYSHDPDPNTGDRFGRDANNNRNNFFSIPWSNVIDNSNSDYVSIVADPSDSHTSGNYNVVLRVQPGTYRFNSRVPIHRTDKAVLLFYIGDNSDPIIGMCAYRSENTGRAGDDDQESAFIGGEFTVSEVTDCKLRILVGNASHSLGMGGFTSNDFVNFNTKYNANINYNVFQQIEFWKIG